VENKEGKRAKRLIEIWGGDWFRQASRNIFLINMFYAYSKMNSNLV